MLAALVIVFREVLEAGLIVGVVLAASRGVTRGWAGSPDPAVGYLAARTRRGRRGDPGLAPSSLRRRAAALKGFYRYAYGEGLIGVDVAAHLDLPRPSRLLPETLTVDEIDRLLEAAGGEETDDTAEAAGPGSAPSHGGQVCPPFARPRAARKAPACRACTRPAATAARRRARDRRRFRTRARPFPNARRD